MIRFRGAAAMLTALTMLLSVAGCSGQEPSGSQATVESTVAVTQPTEAPQEVKLDKIISGMTLEEKVGQLFYVRCPDEGATQWITDYHLGGFVLFGRDFAEKTVEQVRHDIQSYQQASIKVPLLIGVDEEGGSVVRVSDVLRDEPFLSPKDYFADGGWQAVENAEREKADLLLSLGINVNLAPVVDITSDEETFIFRRSFSDDPALVCSFAERTVGIYRDKKLGSTLKHFPGYGDNEDTHTGIAHDSRPYSDFLTKDFLPFEAGIKAGADCVMVSHNIMESVDAERPASLSDKVHQILRRDLNFNGVIMTDDLIMEAITDYTGSQTAAVTAVQAGNDLLCCSDLENQYPAVLTAVQNQEIPMEQLDRSVKRVLKWKQSLGLLDNIDPTEAP